MNWEAPACEVREVNARYDDGIRRFANVRVSGSCPVSCFRLPGWPWLGAIRRLRPF